MELIGLIKDGGPFAIAAVLGFLYMAERAERKEAQSRCDELNGQFLERIIHALNGASQATRDVTSAVQVMNTTFQTTIYRFRDKTHEG